MRAPTFLAAMQCWEVENGTLSSVENINLIIISSGLVVAGKTIWIVRGRSFNKGKFVLAKGVG